VSAPVVSVIVPVFDEAAELPRVLDHLDGLAGEWEVVVADGGSGDGTAEIARERGLTVVTEGATRAAQMNAAAREASGQILCFLHADSRLPPLAHASIAAAAQDAGVVGGNFCLRFHGDDRFSRFLTVVYAVLRRFGFYYGDSSVWVLREAFERLGGYRPLAIMEDYDFVRRLGRLGLTRCLPGPALTSPRRWQEMGVPRTLVTWGVIHLLFLVGVSPRRLADLYARVR